MSFNEVTNCYTDEADKGRRSASSAEERAAWDRYAAAHAISPRWEDPNGLAEASADFADAMLAERRKRFGSRA